MPKESERTKLMKENFMSLHNRGLTISEIAQKYNLSDQTVYNSLQAIADANGVSRESLLQVIKTPSDKAYAREVEKVKVDVGNLIHGFENGNIESEEGSSLPNFSEKEAKLRFAELINLPEAGELTINELKAIAVLQEIVKAYKSSDYTTVEVIFENNKMEEIWNIINWKLIDNTSSFAKEYARGYYPRAYFLFLNEKN